MVASLNPEEEARVLIDAQLIAAGWVVQDREAIDLVNHIGVAVREVIMENLESALTQFSAIVEALEAERK